MDSLITAAARALAAGDPLGALNRVALRDDPPALALRGIAMAQLGDLDRAKILLRRAARAFGARERVSRARCVVAEAEIALVSRELTADTTSLEDARTVLERHGDHLNAHHAALILARRLLLIGRLEDSERTLEALDRSPLPDALRAGCDLVAAGIAWRRFHARAARAALARAAGAARRSGIGALSAEIERAVQSLEAPAARSIITGRIQPLRLDEVETLVSSSALVVDGFRRRVQVRTRTVSLASRPVLFSLARTLGEAWPADVTRSVLIDRAFGSKSLDESHRVRLRVEIGRLRRLLRPIAEIRSTAGGFSLVPRVSASVAVLAPPRDAEHAEVLALLADGESWSSAGLALALGISQRTVQRALESLAGTGEVQSLGRGRTRRWITAPTPGFATTLLLPGPLPGG
jgi:hypothetical protein